MSAGTVAAGTPLTDAAARRAHRILFVDHCARMGGAEVTLLQLVEDLLARGQHVEVVLAEEGPFGGLLREAGAEVAVFPGLGISPSAPSGPGAARPSRSLGQWRALVGHLRRSRPDVVHVVSARSLLTVGPVLVALGLGPRVWTAHDMVVPSNFPRPVCAALRLAAPLLTHRVVANSRATRASLGRAGRRAVVIHPGVGPVAPSTTGGTGPLRVLMLGRIAPLKGQDVLVDAVARAVDRTIEVDIVGEPMFGEHGYEADLVERIAAAGLADRVRLRGPVADPSTVFADHDVLVHATRWPEAFGRVVAEGLMAGLAVVATRTGGPAEQVTDGVDGLLVDPDDPAALAAALDRLAADPDLRARLRAAAPEAGARFGRDQQVEGHLALYDELAPPAPPAAPGPPGLTVVVPSYRRPDSLRRTLESLDRLEDQPDEVLVVAQPADVPTWETAAAHGVRVVPTAPGLAAAMAAGAAAATTEVLAFTDDDAEPLPDWTARIRAAYRDDPRLGAFGGRDLVDGDTDDPVPSEQVGRLTWFGRILGWHHAGVGAPQRTHQLKGVNLSARRDLVVAADLGRRVRGTGAQHGNELFVTASALRSGWGVVYDPDLQVVHHVEPRDDGTIRSGKQLAQLADDMANLAGASVRYLPGIRRVSVPLYAVLVGERVRPGLVAGVLLRFVDHDHGAAAAVAAVWRGVGRGVLDARRERNGGGRR